MSDLDRVHAELLWFIDQPQQLPIHPAIHTAYQQLAELVDALPPSFSTATALRKLLESRDACVRACSQNLLERQQPLTEWALAKGSPCVNPDGSWRVVRHNDDVSAVVQPPKRTRKKGRKP